MCPFVNLGTCPSKIQSPSLVKLVNVSRGRGREPPTGLWNALLHLKPLLELFHVDKIMISLLYERYGLSQRFYTIASSNPH